MALKQFYTDEAQIPTELKDAYVLKDGKYELQVEGFESITGVLAKNTELIGKQKTDDAEIKRQTAEVARLNGEIGKLAGDLSQSQSKAVPTGFVAVSKKDNELIAKLKEQNLKPEDVLTTLTETETLKKENADFKLNQSIIEFAKAENIQNVDALTRLIKQDNLTPQVKEVDENGTKVKKGFLVTNAETPEEKPYAEYKDAQWGAFSSALDAQPKKPGNGHDPPPSGGATGLFDRIRENVKKDVEKPKADIDARFGKAA